MYQKFLVEHLLIIHWLYPVKDMYFHLNIETLNEVCFSNLFYFFTIIILCFLLGCDDKSLNVIPSMIVFDYEIVSVYCHNDVNAVIDCANNVFTWGRGNNNMLGHNNSFCVNRPKEVKFLSGKLLLHIIMCFQCYN